MKSRYYILRGVQQQTTPFEAKCFSDFLLPVFFFFLAWAALISRGDLSVACFAGKVNSRAHYPLLFSLLLRSVYDGAQ